ncbi:uncharacterized protein STEHIDRAFT_144262 [Stereum hirsutum FP-91666 SS1]|uniref:uncharacterized protein n=1 Tax=Stereum hirsutum (strain FP-91666) TaxID=721885 RepID=UPI000440E6CC|nr:uncharacterized protein STEHIDRAFT_144262 [Stereum hirsutum FP-91666 SS1]EIM90671.1 hypothetical protein STEHIDRAFT_144262 [Stereum hirsutum FP-91666 SS1]
MPSLPETSFSSTSPRNTPRRERLTTALEAYAAFEQAASIEISSFAPLIFLLIPSSPARHRHPVHLPSGRSPYFDPDDMRQCVIVRRMRGNETNEEPVQDLTQLKTHGKVLVQQTYLWLLFGCDM